MRTTTLIIGAAELIGSHLAARILREPGPHRVAWIVENDDISYNEQLRALVVKCAIAISTESSGVGLDLSDLLARLDVLSSAWGQRYSRLLENLSQMVPIGDVWFLGGSSPHGDKLRVDELFDLGSVLSLALPLQPFGFHYVDSCYIAHSDAPCPYHLIANKCASSSVPFRLYRTSLISGIDLVRLQLQGYGDLPDLLMAIAELKDDVCERFPSYFECEPLRWYLPETTQLNIIDVNAAIEQIIHMAAQPHTAGKLHHIFSPRNLSIAAFCETVGKLYNIELIPTNTRRSLNAIDRVFEQKIGNMRFGEMSSLVDVASGVRSTDSLDAHLSNAIVSIRQRQVSECIVRNERLSRLPDEMEHKFTQASINNIEYLSVGTGPTLVLLNPIGQGSLYWYPVIDQLRYRYRIITWDAQGLVPGSPIVRLKDQVDALDTILAHENVGQCHLVTWCNGSYIALGFYLRKPEQVSTMVFLNCGIQVPGRPALDTPYERNLERFCRSLDQDPRIAGVVAHTLRTSAQDSDLTATEQFDSEGLASHVLALPNQDLRSHVLAPFRTGDSTLRYARQITDLLSHNPLQNAKDVKAPILLVGCECDNIASAEKVRTITDLFPYGSYIELAGASHYSLYDRPTIVAKMIHAFHSGIM